MESFSKLLSALSGFAWPAVILFAGFYFRVQIRSLFQLARQQIAAGAALKWKDFEFKGLDLASFDTRDGTGYRQELAEKFFFDKRHASYKANKNLFLVHRVRLLASRIQSPVCRHLTFRSTLSPTRISGI
jgi:hypothetical protein